MKVVKCSTPYRCNKCQSEHQPIVVRRGCHLALYCANCGAYIKFANPDDKERLIVSHFSIEDGTPMKVAMLCTEAKVPY